MARAKQETDGNGRPRWQEYLALADLVPAARNAKRHDLPGIVASVARFGFIQPNVLDERTGRLLGGHGRAEAMASLEALDGRPDDWPDGRSWPPEGVVVVDGRWAIPVDRGWASTDDAEAEAAGVALNRLEEAGGWDQRALAEILADLSRSSTDGLLGTGYRPDDLSVLLAAVAEPLSPDAFQEFHPDSIATEHECPRCGYAWSGSSGPPPVAEA